MTGKVTELPEPTHGWRYHSGTAIYTERLRDGRLIAASLQDTGVPYYTEDEEPSTPAFDLQVDGESLSFGWELAAASITEAHTGAPGTRLLLRHTFKPVELEIVTLAGGDGFFRRQLRLTNTSPTATLGLTSVSPLTGVVWPMVDTLRENLHDAGGVPYRVGWMQDTEWGNEGNFQWQEVPLNAELGFGSLRGRSGYTTPFAVAHNNVYGGYLVVSLAWSANWRMSFRCDYARANGSSRLVFAALPTGPAPMRLIAPGESVDAARGAFRLEPCEFRRHPPVLARVPAPACALPRRRRPPTHHLQPLGLHAARTERGRAAPRGRHRRRSRRRAVHGRRRLVCRRQHPLARHQRRLAGWQSPAQ